MSLVDAVGRYVELWRTPGVPRVMLPAMLARLPVAIEPLAIFLHVSEKTGSYSAGATALALFSGGLAVAWPVHGRLIDRHGLRRVLPVLALLHAVALVGFVAANQGPGWLLISSVVPVALSMAPVGSTVRAAWALILPPGPKLNTANALEAVLIEVFFVIGPAATGLFTGVFSALATTLLAGGMLVVGSLLYGSAPAVATMRKPDGSAEADATGDGPARTRRPWRVPGVVAILVAAGAAAAAFAVLEVAVPATVSAHGSTAATGVALLSLPPAASVLGGLVWGARQHTRRAVHRYLVLLAVALACMIPLVFATSIPVLAVCLFLAGLPLAALSAEEFGLLGRMVPKTVINESFALAATMMAVGSAAGTLLAGAVLGWFGPAEARLLSPAAALVALAAVLWVRDTLSRVDAPASVGSAS
ncbi:MFS transporter [Micromonospora sp. NPDC047793]|uniref:MFS transporter n=1 Tax=unclassified Micromonospora TaxID=2617518 RepID=UPI001033A909|nr:MFS transporter [Verrucosispora sp. SN26_14.1]TBL43306.1 MFS transporter [Verrucosispora sp. SN26_14.1]